MTLTPLGLRGSNPKTGPILPYSENVLTLRKSSLHPKEGNINLMVVYNVHEGIFLDSEIHDPWARSLGVSVGPIWSLETLR